MSRHPIIYICLFISLFTFQHKIRAQNFVTDGTFISESQPTPPWTANTTYSAVTFLSPSVQLGLNSASPQGQITQTLNTSSGINYTLTFDLICGTNGTGGTLYIYWNNTQRGVYQISGAPSNTSLTYSFIGQGSDTLSFLGHSAGNLSINNVSVTASAIPEPASYAIALALIALAFVIAQKHSRYLPWGMQKTRGSHRLKPPRGQNAIPPDVTFSTNINITR